MSSLLRANTLKLQEHADLVRREQQTVCLLAEQLRLAQKCALPDDAWRYDRMIDTARKVERYFGSIADQVEYMSFELAKMSVTIGELFTDAAARADRTKI